MNKKQTALISIMRLIIWSIWLLTIAVPAWELGWTWLPWAGVGLLFAWQMDWWVTHNQMGKMIMLLVPFGVLADFVIDLT